MPNITQIPAPRVPLIETNSGLMTTQWFRYFNNINTIVGGGTGVTPTTSGGTGTSVEPLNGQILIGNNTGAYTVAYLTAGTGLFQTPASGALTVGISDTGITAGSYGSASAVSTFNVNAQGQLTSAATTPISISTSQITSGLLAIARGGTNSLATPTNGGISYGTGTAYAFSVAGIAGQVLTSAGAASPTWTSQSSLAVGTATNLAGGATGSVPYQASAGSTTFLSAGTNGQVLTLAAGVPTWVNPTTGTVTSVTATAPVVSSGGAAPNISMAAATTSVNGYLTSTDWTTFNNKGSGTVTSVAALTLGTTGTDLTSSVATGTTTPVITLNVPTASASNRGALSAADWTTFNNKGSGSVTSVSFTGGLISVATATTTPALTVAGTSGGVPYFTSASTWASSAVLASNALMIGGGVGATPATTTTGTGVLTALGTNIGTAGSFVVNGGALGTPSSGTVTNLTGTASININGTVGASTPSTGAFTTLSATSQLTLTNASDFNLYASGAGRNYMAAFFGAGTTSPAVQIHISTTDQSTSRLRLQNTGAGGTTFDLVSGNPGASNSGFAIYDVTNAATRLYVSSAGAVSISSQLNLTNASNYNLFASGAGLNYMAANLGIATTNILSRISFPVGEVAAVQQAAVTTHLASNAGSLGFGISDGGGLSGLIVSNVFGGTFNSQYSSIFASYGGVRVSTEIARFNFDGVISLGAAPGAESLRVTYVASSVNYLNVSGSTGTTPTLSSAGTGANIDILLAPKGTGNVSFGTFTAGILAQTGYITVKDAGGTVRRLLVG